MMKSRKLVRELVREVVIAGEVDIADLYADYRPEDAKAYLGMVPASTTDASSVRGVEAALDDTGDFLDAEIDPEDGPSDEQ